jgi:hypothetical protein
LRCGVCDQKAILSAIKPVCGLRHRTSEHGGNEVDRASTSPAAKTFPRVGLKEEGKGGMAIFMARQWAPHGFCGARNAKIHRHITNRQSAKPRKSIASTPGRHRADGSDAGFGEELTHKAPTEDLRH